MGSHKHLQTIGNYHSQAGFTLAEVVVVISLIAVLGGFTLLVSMDSYRMNAFQNDRDELVTALHHARAESVANVCLDNSGGTYCDDGRGRAHGVAVRPLGKEEDYVIFQVDAGDGQPDTYANRDPDADQEFPSSANLLVTGANEIVFAQLSGNVGVPNSNRTITLRDGVHESIITIGSEGQISWTH